MRSSSEGFGGMRLRVVYDNHPPALSALRSGWGFSCLIEGFEKTILFDAGTSGPILLGNLAALDADPRGIDAVVISHGDWDHLGGLWTLLDVHPQVEVFLPASLSSHLMDEVASYAGRLRVVGDEPVSICPGVRSGGEMDGPRKEQALFMETPSRGIVLAGCAHPGIVEMVRRFVASCQTPRPLLVMGGFHLGRASEEETLRIIRQLKALGVGQVAPTHCTGERAEALFARHFPGNFFPLGPGSRLDEAALAEKPSSAIPGERA